MHELLARVKRLAGRERGATAALIAHLAELDARRVYLAEGCSSQRPARMCLVEAPRSTQA